MPHSQKPADDYSGTLAEMAAYFGIAMSTAEEWVKSKKVHVWRLGRRRRIPETEIVRVRLKNAWSSGKPGVAQLEARDEWRAFLARTRGVPCPAPMVEFADQIRDLLERVQKLEKMTTEGNKGELQPA